MKKPMLAWLAGVCATLALPVVLALPIEPGGVRLMEHAIDVEADSGQLMGAVLVARNGKLLIDRAYGLANIALRVPNAPDTRFRVGSITKEFTAASILILQQEGKLNIDDPVSKYLPDTPASWDKITLLDLLTHTSGIPDLSNLPNYGVIKTTYITPEQLVARFKGLQLDFPPGSSWHYSNSGYVLLGYLIEKISGEPYGRFLHDHLFAPLHMWHSGYEASAARLPGEAVGYVRTPAGPAPARPINMSALFSAGGAYSTTGDLLKWLQGLYSGKVLTPRSLAMMSTVYRHHCGLGLEVERGRNGVTFLTQGGVIDGFNTRIVYVPSQRLAVIVLANLSGGSADLVARQLREMGEGEPVRLVSDSQATLVSDAALERLTGHYWTDEGTFLAVRKEGHHLQTLGLGPARELYARNALEFFSKTQNVEVSFAGDDAGEIDSLIFRLPDRDVRAVRLNETQVRALCDERARKLKARTASAGSAEALRDFVKDVVSGRLDDNRLAPPFAELAQSDLSRLQQTLERLGALQRVEFMGVAPVTGEDIYLVSFANGSAQMRIGIGLEGKIWSEEIRPLR